MTEWKERMTGRMVVFVVEDEHQVKERSFPFVPQGFGSRAQDDREGRVQIDAYLAFIVLIR